MNVDTHPAVNDAAETTAMAQELSLQEALLYATQLHRLVKRKFCKKFY